MKSFFISKSFNSWIIKVCFAFFLISIIPGNAIAVNVNIYGNVYNDLDGSAGTNKVDGTPIGSPGGTQLYATLVQGVVTVLSTAVDPYGSYSFMNQALGNYTVLISTTNYATGFVNPVPSLPSGWTFNGEINNDATNSLMGNTPPTDGILSINLTTYDSNINFGIIQSGSGATVNPGGPDNVCQSVTPSAITLNGASVGGLATTGAWSITSPSGSGTLSSTAQTATPSTVTYTPAANFTGTVTLTLTTNSNGFPAVSGTRTINVNPLPSSSLTASNDACVGSSIVYTILAGMSNYAWTVSSGGIITAGGGSTDNTVTVTWNTAGIENVSVNFTSGNGCTASDSRNVPVKALPTCSITGPDGPLTPSSNGNIYTAPAGKSYVWTISGNATIPGSTTSQTVSISTGASCGVSFTLSLEITDLPSPIVSCSSICNKVVNVFAIPTIIGQFPATRCGTGTVILGATTSAGIINWYDAQTGGTLVGTGTSFTTPVISASTTYYIDATDACGTTSVRTSVIATVNPLPTVSAITGTASVCVGSTIQLADATNFGSWSSASTGVATITAGGAGGPGGLVTGVSAGTSVITYTINSGGCTNSVNQLVTVNALPTATAGGPNNVCQSGTPNAITLSGSSLGGSATTGAWSIFSGVGTLSNTVQTATPATVTYTPAANYFGPIILRLTTNDPNSCGAATSDRTINVNPLPTVAAINGPATVCVGSTIQLTESSGGGFWSSGSTNIASINAAGLVIGAAAGTSEITYSVSNMNGCTNSVKSTIIVTDIPTITGTTPATRCGTGTVSLGATASGGTINWFDAITSGNLVGSGNSFTTPTISTSTTYYVEATNNGCTSSSRTAVLATVNPSLTTPIIGTITQSTCSLATGSVVLSSLPATGTWTVTESVGSTTITGTGTTGTFSGLTANAYTFTVTNSSSCTSGASASAVITAAPGSPNAPVTTVTQPTCSVATGTITVTVQNAGETYSFDNGVTFQSSNNKSGLAAGSYNVMIKSTSGCNSSATPTTINAQPGTTSPVTTVTQPTCSLATGTITVTVQNASDTYSFDNGVTFQTSNIKSGLVAGSYNVIIKSAGGCKSTATSTTLNAQVLPATPAVIVTQPTCSLATGTITVTVQNAGDTYSFDNGVSFQASNIKSGLVAGSYNVIIKNTGGCNSTAAPTTINAQPTSPIITYTLITNPSSCGANGSIVLNFSNVANGTYTILYTLGSFTGVVVSGGTATIYAPVGTYTNLQITVGGCTSVTGVNAILIDPSAPATPAITITQPTCTVATGSITITVQIPTDSFSFDNGVTFQSENIKSGLVAGNYNVIIKSIGGCNSPAASATINSLPNTPVTPIVSVTQPTCSLPTGSVLLSDLPSGNWTINPGNITGSTASKTISGLTTGTYNYSVTNSTGCVSAFTSDIVISAQPLTPTVPIISVTQPTCAVGTGSITVTTPTGSDLTYSIGGAYQSSQIFSGISTGTYSVTAMNSDGCISAPTAFTLVAPSCNNIDLAVVETVNTSIAVIGQTVIFTIVATNNGPDNATGTSVAVKLPSGFTFVSTSNTIGTYDSQTGLWTIGNMTNGSSETLTITATVNATGNYTMTAIIKCDEVEATLVNNTSTAELIPTDFFIPDAFTPNGDGFNDLFEIKHPVSTKIEIEIFNRWGNLVYKSTDYQNDWDGKGTGNFLGKDLPDGTYYCSYKELNASTGEIVLKGVKYITLRR